MERVVLTSEFLDSYQDKAEVILPFLSKRRGREIVVTVRALDYFDFLGGQPDTVKEGDEPDSEHGRKWREWQVSTIQKALVYPKLSTDEVRKLRQSDLLEISLAISQLSMNGYVKPKEGDAQPEGPTAFLN